MESKKRVIFIFSLGVLLVIFLQNSISAGSLQPRIYSISTVNSKFTNGEFIAKYNSDDIDKMILHYGTNGLDMKELVKTDCESGRNVECSFKPDLSEYENQNIKYFFVIINNNGDIGQSIKKKVKIDTIPPVIENPDSFFNAGTGIVNFDIKVDDENFDKIVYVNNFDSERQIVLCRNSNNKHGCRAKKRLERGNYDYTITVFDKAGNSISQNINFNII